MLYTMLICGRLSIQWGRTKTESVGLRGNRMALRIENLSISRTSPLLWVVAIWLFLLPELKGGHECKTLPAPLFF